MQSILIFILPSLQLLLFSPSTWAASSADENISRSQKEFYSCQLTGIKTLDDGQTDVRSIALKLTNYCEKQYAQMNKTAARHNIDNSNERRMFTIDQNAKQIKIEASLEIVLSHRQETPDNSD